MADQVGTEQTQTTSATGTETLGQATEKPQNDGSLLTQALDAPKPDPGKDGKPVDQKPVVPEKYEFKAPEGQTLDAKALEAATPIFKELGLSQEGAQKLVDFYNKQVDSITKSSVDAFTKQRTDWREELKSDPVLGKDLAPDGKVPVTVNKALDALQNPKLVADFKDAMNMTGAGDNPAFVRVLYALASKLTEGTSYAQGSPVGQKGPPTPAAAVYPNLKSAGG